MQTMPGQPRAVRGWPARWGWTAIRCAGPVTGPRPGSGSPCSSSPALAAFGVGGWAYHAGTAVARVQAAPAHHVKAAVPATTVTPADLPKSGEGNWVGARAEGTAASARSGEVLAEVMTPAFMALASQAALRLTRAFLTSTAVSIRRLTCGGAG
jgi:hypothetical protein